MLRTAFGNLLSPYGPSRCASRRYALRSGVGRAL
jgi:hypothetical protein